MPARKTQRKRTRTGLSRKTRLSKTRRRSSRLGRRSKSRSRSRSRSSARAKAKPKRRWTRRRRLGGDGDAAHTNDIKLEFGLGNGNGYKSIVNTDRNGNITGFGNQKKSTVDKITGVRNKATQRISRMVRKKCSRDTECDFNGVANSGQCRDNRCEKIPKHILAERQREKTAQYNSQRFKDAYNKGLNSKYDDKQYDPATDGPNTVRFKKSRAGLGH